MAYRVSQSKRLLSVLVVTLLIALTLVGPVSAHGGEGDHSEAPAPGWMIGLIYVQILTVPFVGIWLFRDALAAWLPHVDRKRIGMEVQ